MAERRKRGPVELATQRSIRELGDLPPGMSALPESALALARFLDQGAEMATAAVARELRATLTQLAAAVEPEEERDPFDAFVDDLAAPVPAAVLDSAQS